MLHTPAAGTLYNSHYKQMQRKANAHGHSAQAPRNRPENAASITFHVGACLITKQAEQADK
jgi:hypothetical protein